MNFLQKLILDILSIPARMRGMKLGKKSFFTFPYFLLYSFNGIVIGKNVTIARNAWIEARPLLIKNPEVIIADGTSIARNFTAVAVKKIKIGRLCFIGMNVTIYDFDHDIFDKSTPPLGGHYSFKCTEDVIIEDECFIGTNSIILKGVHLGKHFIVGAGSVITKSFPAYSVIAGNPARLLRTLK